MSRSRGALLVAAVAAAAVVVVLLLSVRGGGTTGPATPATSPPAPTTAPSPPGEGIAEATATTVPRPAAAGALCAVRPEELRRLPGVADGSPETLRDAVPLLDERLDRVRTAVAGRDGLTPVVRRLEVVRARWADAVAAGDAGDAARAGAALSAAGTELERLGAEIRSAYPGAADECAG